MTPDRFYGFDIETDTTIDGLDPEVAPIIAVAIATPDHHLVFTGPERDILVDTERALSDLEPGVLVTWNGSGFDLPFLARRLVEHDLAHGLLTWPAPELGSRRSGDGERLGRVRGRWGAHRHLDAYLAYRSDVGRSLGIPCGLKPLSRLVGYSPVEVDRTAMERLTPDELREYVASDAVLARRLALRRHPSIVASIDPDSCG